MFKTGLLVGDSETSHRRNDVFKIMIDFETTKSADSIHDMVISTVMI